MSEYTNQCDTQYLALVKDVLENGDLVPTRAKIDGKNVGAYSVIGRQARFDLTEGFPILTTKRVHFESIIHELIWFLSGSSNIKYLKDNNVNIWNSWADPQGELGYGTYGSMWRKFPFHEFDFEFYKHYNIEKSVNYDLKKINGTGISYQYRYVYCEPERDIVGWVDQIKQLLIDIEKVKQDPTASEGRRLIVTAWHPYYTDKVGLPPCHCLFQFTVRNGTLSCHLYQRSCDLFLGVPFNISSYSALTYVIAHLTGLKPKEFIHTYHDLHIYENHIDQMKEQLTREHQAAPQLEFVGDFTIDNFARENVKLVGYKHSGTLRGEVAV